MAGRTSAIAVPRAADWNIVPRRPAASGAVASRTLAAVAQRAALIWNGRRSGCLDFTSAANAAMCGAAKLLPVVVVVPPSSHGTSTAIPRARNSVGGSGLAWNRSGSVAVLQATLATEANNDG